MVTLLIVLKQSNRNRSCYLGNIAGKVPAIPYAIFPKEHPEHYTEGRGVARLQWSCFRKEFKYTPRSRRTLIIS